MDEDSLNLEIRKFLKEVGITSQREIEKVVRSGKVRGNLLKLRMVLSSETAPLDHVVEGTINLGAK
jgi:16S rRNA U516 pseudouridylate synthase RsuA-like enzyme